MNLLVAASAQAHATDLLILALLGVSGVLVIAVWASMIVFCVKYRKGSPADRANPPTKPRKLEMGLSAGIFLLGLGLFIYSAKLYYDIYAGAPNAHEIYVTAKQWMWIIHDPHGHDDINHITVEAGKPVRLIMISQDVVHSFFVPALRIKQDVIPGRYTSLSFTPDKPGKYEVFCAQYCGLDHAYMRAVVEVVSPQNTRAEVK